MRRVRQLGRFSAPAHDAVPEQQTDAEIRTQDEARLAKYRGSSRGTSTRGRAQTRSSGKSNTDLNEIRRWAEKRGGKPVTVSGTGGRGKPGLLRIDFPGYSGAGRLEEISWADWYQKFNQSNLEFLYQDKDDSRFSKLVRRGRSKRGRGKK